MTKRKLIKDISKFLKARKNVKIRDEFETKTKIRVCEYNNSIYFELDDLSDGKYRTHCVILSDDHDSVFMEYLTIGLLKSLIDHLPIFDKPNPIFVELNAERQSIMDQREPIMLLGNNLKMIGLPARLAKLQGIREMTPSTIREALLKSGAETAEELCDEYDKILNVNV